MNKTLKYSIIALASLTVVGGAIVIYRKRRGISKLAKNAIAIAKHEYEDWNSEGVQRKEDDSSMYESIKKYWQEGADTFWSKAKMINEAWSAAFISYIMKKAGAGDDFKYSTSHSVYIRDSINNRKKNKKNPFKGFKPQEVKVEEGDLVCYPRQGGVNYDSTGAYKSHCDFVIDVKDNIATSIGGNVSNSVSKTSVELDKEGKIKDSKYFVVIKNKK